MAVLTPQNTAVAGTVVTMAAASAGGDSFDNNGEFRVLVRNASGGALTITFDAPGTDNFGVTGNEHDITAVSIAAGAIMRFGPFRTDRFNDSNGRVQITYPGGVTSLTIAVLGR